VKYPDSTGTACNGATGAAGAGAATSKMFSHFSIKVDGGGGGVGTKNVVGT